MRSCPVLPMMQHTLKEDNQLPELRARVTEPKGTQVAAFCVVSSQFSTPSIVLALLPTTEREKFWFLSAEIQWARSLSSGGKMKQLEA
jgi:hypothetical protein